MRVIRADSPLITLVFRLMADLGLQPIALVCRN
jgi:hypothetical protein